MKEVVQALMVEARRFDIVSEQFHEWRGNAVAGFVPVARKLMRLSFDEGGSVCGDDGMPLEVECLVNRLARAARSGSRQRLDLSIEAASIEFVRSQLEGVLWLSAQREYYAQLSSIVPERVQEFVNAVPWGDCDGFMRARANVWFGVFGAADTAASVLHDRLSSLSTEADVAQFQQRAPSNLVDPPLRQTELMAAIALHWIDLALISGSAIEAMEYMAMAADAADMHGFDSGWTAAEEARRDQAQRAGKLRHEKSPKSAEKRFVQECWFAWQKVPHEYPGVAAFARAMLEKVPEGTLRSQQVIERWARQWSMEKSKGVS